MDKENVFCLYSGKLLSVQNLSPAITWISLRHYANEISQSQKDILNNSVYIVKLIEAESRIVVDGLGEGKIGSCLAPGVGFHSCKMQKV